MIVTSFVWDSVQRPLQFKDGDGNAYNFSYANMPDRTQRPHDAAVAHRRLAAEL